jgi:hypothetical protein
MGKKDTTLKPQPDFKTEKDNDLLWMDFASLILPI